VNNILKLFWRRNTAAVARERLQILLAHERASAGQEGLVVILREEILAVIAKHVTLDRDKVRVKLEREGEISMLEIDVEMPAALQPLVAARVWAEVIDLGSY
jgi:cell division topological specificity factor